MRKSLKKSLIYLIMTMLIMPTWLVTGMLKAPHAKAAGPTTLAEWNFPNNPDNAVADNGVSENLTKEITSAGGTGVVTFNTLGVTTQEARAASWDSGSGLKYWLIDIVTTNYQNIKLSSKQSSSNTGPKDFKLQISTDGLVWSDSIGGTITVANNYTTGVLSNLALANTANNQPNLQIRWIMTSDLAVGGGNVGSSGASAIDDIKITADENLTAYNAAIAAVTQPNYTDASWAAYQLIVSANAITVASTQLEIDTATLAITTAQADLVTKIAADGLAVATTAAEAKVPADYTQTSWNIFSVEVIDALGLPDTTNAQILTKTAAINNAISKLVFTGQADLDVAILTANSKVEADYTPASWTALKNALLLPSTTNTDVIAKTAAINTALSNLVNNAAKITNETIKTVGNTFVVITWTTDHNATSRVIYDKVSHNITGASYPNYGYVFSTQDSSALTTMSHSVLISGLTPGTTYYYRTISEGSPVAVGEEKSFKTTGTAPGAVKTVEPAPATTSVAPQQAQGAASTTTPAPSTPAVTNANTNGDANGQIKGDESTNTTEKINWTPWIVLFVLIVLAGAATGGYFYWFAGEDEVKSVVREPKKVESEKVVTSVKSKQNGVKPNKKSKRW